MIQSLTCWCVAVPMAFGAAGVVDEPSGLARTVEDVETLRVLVTKSLGASVALDSARARALNTYSRFLGVKADEDGEGEDDRQGDEGDAKSDSRPPNEAISNWLVNSHQQAWTNTVGSYYFGQVDSATSYTRAFYAPGVGAWIDTNLKVPYAFESASNERESENSAADDDWVAAKRTLRSEEGGAGAEDTATARTLVISLDPRKIEAAIDGVIDVLREHGHRIRGLASDESVTVAMKIEASGFDENDGLRTRFLRGWTVDAQTLQPGVSVRVSSRPAVRTVVIRASKSLLEAAANGDVDAGAFAKRVVITRY